MTDISTWASQYSSNQQRIREHNNRLAQDSTPAAPHAKSAFEDFVIDQLQALLNSSSNTKEVADAIAASFCRDKKPEAAWSAFVCAFLSAAGYADDARLSQRLAHLLLELCLRPQAFNESGVDMEMHINIPFGDSPKIKPGEPIVDATGLRYFADAPWFSMEVGEAWNDPETVGPYAEDLDLSRVRFTNLNVFLAHRALAGTSVNSSPFGTWPETFGLMAIANALETPDQETSDDDVHVAAKWFQICGKAIYDKPNWGFEGNGTPPGSEGELWKARKCEDDSADARWNFWIQRASELAANPSTNKGVHGAATDCLRYMSDASETTLNGRHLILPHTHSSFNFRLQSSAAAFNT